VWLNLTRITSRHRNSILEDNDGHKNEMVVRQGSMRMKCGSRQ
jgi:hypothetical protein